MASAVLKKGASGATVKAAQRALAKRLKLDIEPDGKFGPTTEEHVRAFQKKHKLKVDGILGPKTMAALMPASATGGAGAGSGQTKSVKKLRSDLAKLRKLKGRHNKELARIQAGIAKAGDDAELVQMLILQLQQALQRQSQIVQTLSNLLKVQHDSAMSAIRNIR